MNVLRITNGRVIDPAQNLDLVTDLWIRGERIVASGTSRSFRRRKVSTPGQDRLSRPYRHARSPCASRGARKTRRSPPGRGGVGRRHHVGGVHAQYRTGTR